MAILGNGIIVEFNINLNSFEKSNQLLVLYAGISHSISGLTTGIVNDRIQPMTASIKNIDSSVLKNTGQVSTTNTIINTFSSRPNFII